MGVSPSLLWGSLFPGGPQSEPQPPPKVVLVPPFFQRDVRGLSRFCHSSYDYLANRKALSRLLRDHLSPELRGTLLLSPRDDPRVSVRAKLRQAGGSMVLRWQPSSAAAVHTFLEMAANLESPGDVSFRGSVLHEASGLGAFMVAPLAKHVSGDEAQVGLRYSSSSLTAGAIFTPRSGSLQRLWLAGRAHGLTLGVQLSPPGGLPLRTLLADSLVVPNPNPTPLAPTTSATPPPAAPPTTSTAASTDTARPSATPATAAAAAGSTETTPPIAATASGSGSGSGSGGGSPSPLDRLADLGFWLRNRSSLLLAYSPVQTPGATGPPFTAAVELEAGEALTFSFFQHVAATRQVMNPFEEGEVVGITNYLDIGLQLTTPVGPNLSTTTTGSVAGGSRAGAGAAASQAGKGHGAAGDAGRPATINLAAAWQINKNWLVKARVGSDSAAAAVGARVWHAVSAYLTASVSVDYATRTPKYGAELCVENFGPLRYERGADDVAAGRAVLQQHEASPQDLANFAGRGVLVRRSTGAGAGTATAAAGAASRELEERLRVAELM